MITDSVTESSIIICTPAVGTATRAMVRTSATELALIDGRTASDVSKSDWEQAKRELNPKFASNTAV